MGNWPRGAETKEVAEKGHSGSGKGQNTGIGNISRGGHKEVDLSLLRVGWNSVQLVRFANYLRKAKNPDMICIA